MVKDYYSTQSHYRDEAGSLILWKLYNLSAGANKMNYIDTFITGVLVVSNL
ncbi:MAG: DUF3871 family protein [Draconibacterium sp.]|nr:DUF3871 family protein [Draconibacterium sp.]